MKKTSIKDIANVVGVSTATVSIVLSNKAKEGRVSKEMISKIKGVAAEMNYQPNLLAQSLQSGQSKTIGLLIADITNPFFSLLAFHVQKEMYNHDYAVIIVNTDEDSEQMATMVSLLKNRQVDGFIIVPTEGSIDLIRELKESKSPLVLVDRAFPEIDTCNVLVDNYRAAYGATTYLLEQGCKNIAFITYSSDLIQVKDRERGYKDAMNKAGIFSESDIKRVFYKSLDEDVKSVMQEVKQGEIPYDGVLFATNSISLRGVRVLIQNSVKIGEDIKIVCFDKSDCFDFSPSPLPYIHQPISEIGTLAAKLLIEQIKNKDSEFEEHTHLLPCKFMVK